MNTTNLVSTPNITGNIGSCTTQVEVITTGRKGIFIREISNIETNSCTGEVAHYPSWEFTEGAMFGGALGFMLLIALFMAFVHWAVK